MRPTANLLAGALPDPSQVVYDLGLPVRHYTDFCTEIKVYNPDASEINSCVMEKARNMLPSPKDTGKETRRSPS